MKAFNVISVILAFLSVVGMAFSVGTIYGIAEGVNDIYGTYEEYCQKQTEGKLWVHVYGYGFGEIVEKPCQK